MKMYYDYLTCNLGISVKTMIARYANSVVGAGILFPLNIGLGGPCCST
jgi:hypothetical protein